MIGKAFVDTNIFVYAALKSLDDTEKWRMAINLLNSSRSFVVSTQVLNEFSSVLLRKNITDVNRQVYLPVPPPKLFSTLAINGLSVRS
jgi:predicted nucleic acid-binding protein